MYSGTAGSASSRTQEPSTSRTPAAAPHRPYDPYSRTAGSGRTSTEEEVRPSCRPHASTASTGTHAFSGLSSAPAVAPREPESSSSAPLVEDEAVEEDGAPADDVADLLGEINEGADERIQLIPCLICLAVLLFLAIVGAIAILIAVKHCNCKIFKSTTDEKLPTHRQGFAQHEVDFWADSHSSRQCLETQSRFI